jgi:diketogulonate reductase-like aldo/keto reductase
MSERNIFFAILFSRMIPIIPPPVINIYSGLMKISFRTYFSASFFGMIPPMFMYAYGVEQVFSSLQNLISIFFALKLSSSYNKTIFIRKALYAKIEMGGILMNVTLNNGVTMPQLGFGVFKVEDGQVAIDAVKKAVEVGYRSIDTAAIYKNEAGVGQALQEANVPREELFITTKVWNSDQGYEKTLKAFDESLEKLGLDYVDLYLVHWPMPEENTYIETYRALEKLYEDGRVHAIGVCNFHIHHLERLLAECKVKPVLNQVELHPLFAQTELRSFCAKHNIFVEAWGPLMQGGDVLNHETIKELSEKYSKSPAQIIIRWHLQNNIIVIPKSVTPSRIEENFNVFDFELSIEDKEKIDALDRNERIGPDPEEFHVK